jgi:HD-GYP domain-containing protein (c-di-GMP phosphodiesterase class II)
MKQHALVTEQIVERIPRLNALAPLAAAHHERIDGGGYPRGLAGDELTLPMRILGIADVFAALTTDRPYRAAYTYERALEVIRPDVPERLDSDAFAALETLVLGRDSALRHG